MMMFHTMPGTIIGHAAMSERGRRMMQLHGMALPGWAGGIHAYEPIDEHNDDDDDLAPWEDRLSAAKHEAGHALVAMSHGATVHRIFARRDGSGLCELMYPIDDIRQRLDWIIAGPAAAVMYDMPGAYAGELAGSDLSSANTLLSQIVDQHADNAMAFGRGINPMAMRDQEFRESVQRVQAILMANMSALHYVADLVANRSEHGGHLSGSDIQRFGIVSARQCNCNLWWLN